MRFTRIQWVLVCLGALTGSAPLAARAQSDAGSFRALLSLEVSRQNVIGGSLVDGVDILQQAQRVVMSASVGLRVGVGAGAVVGGDLGIGTFDGRLSRHETAGNVTLDWTGRRQWHWRGLVAYAPRRSATSLAFVYLSEVSRAFDVAIDANGTRFRQRDGQGLLRYGFGFEGAPSASTRVNLTLGTSRAEFGDRRTNFAPRRPLEISAGVLLLTP